MSKEVPRSLSLLRSLGKKSETGGQSAVNSVTGAMLLMLIGMLLLPLMDVMAKLLATKHDVSPVMVVWTRFSGQSILMFIAIPILLGMNSLKSPNLGVNLLRGVLVGAAVSIFFIAIKYLLLADAIAIFFVEPLILIVLSAIFLGEKVGWRRGLAAVVGFCGALLIIQPTYEVFGVKSLLPLLTATFFSVYLMLSSKIGKSEHPLSMQFWSGIGGVFICTLFMLVGHSIGWEDFYFTMPQTAPAVYLLGAIVLIATIGHLLIITAFSYSEASILAPFQYLEIVTMTIAGYFVFGEFPTPIKWLGIAIIIASGLYIFFRERKVGNDSKSST